MPRGRPSTVGKAAVSVRVLLSRADYEALLKIAGEERTDVGTLVRRAVARYFLCLAIVISLRIIGNINAIKPSLDRCP